MTFNVFFKVKLHCILTYKIFYDWKIKNFVGFQKISRCETSESYNFFKSSYHIYFNCFICITSVKNI